MISKTNNSSCTLDSVAFVTGLSAKSLMERIGHSGYYRDGRPRGFSVQEFIQPLWEEGFMLSVIEYAPTAYNSHLQDLVKVNFPVGKLRRFVECLEQSGGVLLGPDQKGMPHAVAWVNGLAHDPNTQITHDIFKRDYYGKKRGIKPLPIRPTTFWRIARYDASNSSD